MGEKRNVDLANGKKKERFSPEDDLGRF